jgi:hypothetical protein
MMAPIVPLPRVATRGSGIGFRDRLTWAAAAVGGYPVNDRFRDGSPRLHQSYCGGPIGKLINDGKSVDVRSRLRGCLNSCAFRLMPRPGKGRM